jgi:hypothetical protein
MAIICAHHGRIATEEAVLCVVLEEGEYYYLLRVTATCPVCSEPMWTTYLDTQGGGLCAHSPDPFGRHSSWLYLGVANLSPDHYWDYRVVDTWHWRVLILG